MSKDVQNGDKVAPADRPYAPLTVPTEEREDGGHEGIHPAIVNPDQPVFPAPVGVDRKVLEDAGVDHTYMPGGGTVAPAGEGRPADPDAEKKDPSSAEALRNAGQ